ncbi:HypC/HybG/HupF family hydrogenase formation chaperone [Lutispora sp.]|uniref:HypC/HybG/HupF family hydrogenase formation chaperone n=1 Tax=Lutispora sp. TaxID=2828727 RepID=UPI002B2001AE|nr:HypC/HybG/HupF family hydrogenase formation chaperone [Lutispora sp.]MEA4961262.1 HypC/HybG/HupF family hydrogenase formation chaperone [Lutispora sp.]
MCIAIPGEIISVEGAYAAVDIMGLENCIYIGLLDNPRKGDLILIHAGCAIKKIDERYFYYLEDTFKHMLEGDY